MQKNLVLHKDNHDPWIINGNKQCTLYNPLNTCARCTSILLFTYTLKLYKQ